jgi:hypothetical protein
MLHDFIISHDFSEAHLRSTFNWTWRIEAQVYISLISAVFPLLEGTVSNIDFPLCI